MSELYPVGMRLLLGTLRSHLLRREGVLLGWLKAVLLHLAARLAGSDGSDLPRHGCAKPVRLYMWTPIETPCHLIPY